MPPLSRTALLTGAGGALGRAFALQAAARGYEVALSDVEAEAAEETLAHVREQGGDGLVLPLDVSSPAAWEQALVYLQNRWPRLDLLINNAGVCGAGEVGQFPLADWHWLLEVNLYGTIYGCHTMIPWLKENPHGAKIINVASIAAHLGAPSMAAYNVAKAGVVALSETLDGELRDAGVGVTVVAPGFFSSPLLDRGRFATPVHRRLAAWHMNRSQITAKQVARLALQAAERGRLHLVLGPRARLLWRLKRCSPTALVRLISRGYRRAIRSAEREKVRSA